MRLVQRLGLPLHPPARPTTPPRGYLLLQGVPAKVMFAMQGHASVTITMNLYVHVLPSMQRAAAEAMEARVRAGCSQRRILRRFAGGQNVQRGLNSGVAPTGIEPAPRGLGLLCCVFITGCLRPPLPFFPRPAALLRLSLCAVVRWRCRQNCRHPLSSAFRTIERPGVSVEKTQLAPFATVRRLLVGVIVAT
jgi:hypothetical protein